MTDLAALSKAIYDLSVEVEGSSRNLKAANVGPGIHFGLLKDIAWGLKNGDFNTAYCAAYAFHLISNTYQCIAEGISSAPPFHRLWRKAETLCKVTDTLPTDKDVQEAVARYRAEFEAQES